MFMIRQKHQSFLAFEKDVVYVYYEKRFDANAKKFMHWKNSAQRQFSTTAGIVTHLKQLTD